MPESPRFVANILEISVFLRSFEGPVYVESQVKRLYVHGLALKSVPRIRKVRAHASFGGEGEVVVLGVVLCCITFV